MGLGVAHRSRPEQAGASLTAARDLAHKARENPRQGLGLHPSSARAMQSRATLGLGTRTSNQRRTSCSRPMPCMKL